MIISQLNISQERYDCLSTVNVAMVNVLKMDAHNYI